jgi:uncharacterized protein (DUF697 family)
MTFAMTIATTFKDTVGAVVSGIDTTVDRIGRAVGADIPMEFASDKALSAMRVVRRYSAVSFAGGFIPLPFVDLLAVSSSQLAMLAEITAIYEGGNIPSKERLRIVASAVLGSMVPQGLSAGVAGSAIKSLPVVGTIAGMVMMPGLSSAATFAIGKAFISHFESGGTFQEIDPEAIGVEVAAELQHAGPDEVEGPVVEAIAGPAIVLDVAELVIDVAPASGKTKFGRPVATTLDPVV